MNKSKGQVIIAALMPHAPVLVPAVGGRRGNRAAASVSAMTEAARRIVKAKPETVVLISPHTPRRRGAFAIWAGSPCGVNPQTPNATADTNTPQGSACGVTMRTARWPAIGSTPQAERIGGSLAQFGAPAAAVDLPADKSLGTAIAEEAGSRGLNIWWLGPWSSAHRLSEPSTSLLHRPSDAELDHGAVVPLWHLADAGWCGPTVLIGLNYPGEPGLAELGEAIAGAARRMDRRVAVVASGDMSHRLQPGAPAGFHPRAKEFDHAFIECLRVGDYRQLLKFNSELQDLAAEDAVDSTLVAASAVNWNAAGHEVLSYEGPFGVGYGVAILYQPPPENASASARETGTRENDVTETGNALVRVARRSLEAVFRSEVEKPAMPAAGILGERHGVFVTIRGPRRKLRGCVGTLTPRFMNTVEETWHVARDAAFHDGRFAPVGAHELEQLRFEVSVLSPLEETASKAELDPQRYGVVLATEDGRRGVLLPDIKEIRTVEQQLTLARCKGGIGESEPVRIQRFAVKKFREED